MAVDSEQQLGRRARGQQGLFTAADAEAYGLSPRTLRRRLAQGLLVERQPGVFAAGTAPYDLPGAECAALLSVGPTAMLSHLSAGWRWRLRRDRPERPWLTLPFVRALPELWDVEVVRSRHVEGIRRIRDGVALTAPPRTVVDLGRVLDRDGVESALAIGLQKGLASMPQVEATLVTAYRTAGTGLVREVVRQFRPEWESLLSARFGRLTAEGGLGLVPGFEIRDGGRVVALLDFAVPDLRLAVEVDGWAYHGSKEQQQADRQRDRMLLVRYGWTTVRYTTQDVLERPEQVLAELAQLLIARAA